MFGIGELSPRRTKLIEAMQATKALHECGAGRAGSGGRGGDREKRGRGEGELC